MYALISRKTDDIILTEGTFEPFIYLVKSGTLNAIQSEGRRIKLLAELGPGDFFGEMAHLGSKKLHAASVIATSDVELIQFEADKIYDILASNPLWLKKLLQNLVKKIENGNAKQELFKKHI